MFYQLTKHTHAHMLLHSLTLQKWSSGLSDSYCLSSAHIKIGTLTLTDSLPLSASNTYTHTHTSGTGTRTQQPTAVAVLPGVDSSIYCLWIMSKVTVHSEGDHKNHTAANHRPNHWIRQMLGETGRDENRGKGGGKRESVPVSERWRKKGCSTEKRRDRDKGRRESRERKQWISMGEEERGIWYPLCLSLSQISLSDHRSRRKTADLHS